MRGLFGLAVMALTGAAAVAAEEKLTEPEVVRVESVKTEGTSKFVVMSNSNGRYTLSCNVKAAGCITPSPRRDFYIFKKETHWKMPGADRPIDLAFVQDWTVSYRQSENIGLVPKESKTGPEGLGMFILEAWNKR